jgi:hypothetical protein
MAGTQIWRSSRIGVAGGRAWRANGRDSSKHGAGLWLWTLLNAQALLDGTAGTPDGVGLIEDDHRRLAARQEN